MTREDVIAAAKSDATRLAGNQLRVAEAVLYSHHSRLAHGQEGLRGWTSAQAQERLADAARLVEVAFVLREEGDIVWRRCLRRAGELLEWLSTPKTLGSEATSRLLAAAAYAAAGYPARADALLKASEDAEESAVLCAYLRGRCADAIELTRTYWERHGARRGTTAGLTTWLVEEVVGAIGVDCSGFKYDDEARAEVAVAKLRAIAELLAVDQDPASWLLARLTAEVAVERRAHSWRSTLAPLMEGQSEAVKAAYERYARLAFLQNRVVAWPSQRIGIRRLASGESFALCTPTGSGKTAVAEAAIVQAVLAGGEDDFFGRIALYLVPSRALAAEVEGKIGKVLDQISSRRVVVTGLYGGLDWGPTDAWLTSLDPAVLICTYEKAEALIRFLGPLFMHRIGLVVFDEAHQVQFLGDLDSLRGGESRSQRLEALGMRIAELVPADCRRIALSAVAAGLEESLHAWVGGTQTAGCARSTYNSTRQLIGRLTCEEGGRFDIHYDLLDGNSLHFRGNDDATPYVPSPVPPQAPVRGAWSGPEKSLRPATLWAAVHLARQVGGAGHRPVLVAIMQQIKGWVKDFVSLLEGDWANAGLPEVFRVPRSPEEVELWTRANAICVDYFGEDSYEYKLLRRGIVVHHAKMPKVLSHLMVRLIQTGLGNVVIATSTLSEGVNIPVETILVPSLRRSNETIGTAEFRNLSGRAGRPGVATEGRTLVVVSSGPSGRASRDRYVEVVREILAGADAAEPSGAIVALLNDLRGQWRAATGSNSAIAFGQWLESRPPTTSSGAEDPSLDILDGVLLAAHVEQETAGRGEWEDTLERIWSRAFDASRAAEEARLGFLLRGRKIPELFPEPARRLRLYRTGLAPRHASQLLDRVEGIKEVLSRGAAYADSSPEARLEFVSGCIAAVSNVPRFALADEPGEWKRLLAWWMRAPGASHPGRERVADWHHRAAQQFTYRFAWGLGSVLSVASEELGDGRLMELSLSNWQDLGLPWSVFWLKEMCTWGTLEPVATLLLAKGQANSRGEAEEASRDYYRQADADSDDVLDPRRIRDWVETLVDRRAAARSADGEIRVDVAVAAEVERVGAIPVLPVVRDGRTTWIDAAGYELAVGDGRERLPDDRALEARLDARRGVVRVARYL